MQRLVAYAHNGVQRFNIDRPELVIGSGDECDIRLPFAGVGSRHALLLNAGEEVRIEDLGARRGLVVNGRRVKEARLEVLDEIRLGSIALLLEDVQVSAPQTQPAPSDHEPEPPRLTPAGMLEHLGRISRWVLSDTASTASLESLVIKVVRDLGGGVVFLFQGEEKRQAIKFVVASEARWLACGDSLLQQLAALGAKPDTERTKASSLMGNLDGEEAWIAYQSFRALDRPCFFVAAFPRFRPRAWSPLPAMRVLADLLIMGLIHHVGQYEPILLSQTARSDLTLAPGLVMGPSQAMQAVLEQMRAAVDTTVHVLLRGEPGVSKELLAKSLHLSGPRREGPFVVASCRGARPMQVEADLFGAELAGRHGPVVREGKLVSSHGGTIFLDDVEHLPLELQDRLMRFMRTREIEPVDSLGLEHADVRLIAGSAVDLGALVARDQMRIDLAYSLSQFVVEVPALRQRREDLPMLIQAAVNRACHESGKRTQGITVKAMEALTAYDYPGNLLELETIVRRLVYLCRSGQPIDESVLPEEIRLAKIKGPRPDAGSELDLDRLVADCERAAILEALRRSAGNKSQAARLLGLSRNGLGLKMRRLELES